MVFWHGKLAFLSGTIIFIVPFLRLLSCWHSCHTGGARVMCFQAFRICWKYAEGRKLGLGNVSLCRYMSPTCYPTCCLHYRTLSEINCFRLTITAVFTEILKSKCCYVYFKADFYGELGLTYFQYIVFVLVFSDFLNCYSVSSWRNKGFYLFVKHVFQFGKVNFIREF